MTFIKEGTEYLDWEEYRVYSAIKNLNAQHRTTNNSQIASATGLSRTKVGNLTWHLKARSYIKNVGKGAAYHWRLTDKKAYAYVRDVKEER